MFSQSSQTFFMESLSIVQIAKERYRVECACTTLMKIRRKIVQISHEYDAIDFFFTCFTVLRSYLELLWHVKFTKKFNGINRKYFAIHQKSYYFATIQFRSISIFRPDFSFFAKICKISVFEFSRLKWGKMRLQSILCLVFLQF